MEAHRQDLIQVALSIRESPANTSPGWSSENESRVSGPGSVAVGQVVRHAIAVVVTVPARPPLEIKEATHALATGASWSPWRWPTPAPVCLRLTGEGGHRNRRRDQPDQAEHGVVLRRHGHQRGDIPGPPAGAGPLQRPGGLRLPAGPGRGRRADPHRPHGRGAGGARTREGGRHPGDLHEEWRERNPAWALVGPVVGPVVLGTPGQSAASGPWTKDGGIRPRRCR